MNKKQKTANEEDVEYQVEEMEIPAEFGLPTSFFSNKELWVENNKEEDVHKEDNREEKKGKNESVEREQPQIGGGIDDLAQMEIPPEFGLPTSFFSNKELWEEKEADREEQQSGDWAKQRQGGVPRGGRGRGGGRGGGGWRGRGGGNRSRGRGGGGWW